ncbi:MAG: hypothetical protein KDA73_04095 [Rhodobacteraceae bacterium]|nr:hypothetical protein [Paracoccaceae bacterium]
MLKRAGEAAPVAFFALLVASVAWGDGIVEIRHKDLKPQKIYTVLYWCVDPADLPAEYTNSKTYVPNFAKHAKKMAGTILMSEYQVDVFLTRESCLEQTFADYRRLGGNPDDLVIVPK